VLRSSFHFIWAGATQNSVWSCPELPALLYHQSLSGVSLSLPPFSLDCQDCKDCKDGHLLAHGHLPVQVVEVTGVFQLAISVWEIQGEGVQGHPNRWVTRGSPCYGVTMLRCHRIVGVSPLSSSTSLVTPGSQDGSVKDRFILLFQEEQEVCATGARVVER